MSSNYFHRARLSALNSVEKLIPYISGLNNKYPEIDFENYVSGLVQVRDLLSKANDRCLTEVHIDKFRRLAEVLVNNLNFGSKYFHLPGIQPKLLKFWSLCVNVLYAPNPVEIVLWRLNSKLSKEDQVNALTNSLENVNRVKAVTSLIVTEVLKNPNSILSITSVLLTLIIRVEAHEYELKKILENIKKYTGLNVDNEELLSVESKVQKGKDWRTDVRAIRDATSHAKFRIDKSKTNYRIVFENSEGGYDFTFAKSGEELLFFYQDYDRMLNLQSRLLSITLLISLLDKVFRIN